MKDTLESFLKSGQFVSVYASSNDTEMFNFGKVVNVSKELVCIQSFDNNAEFSGYRIRATSDVRKIEYDGMYERRLEKLVSRNNEDVYEDLARDLGRQDRFLSVICYAAKVKAAVCLWLTDDDEPLVGLVEGVEREVFTILQYDRSDSPDGFVTTHVSNVGGIDFHTQSLRNLMAGIAEQAK